VLLGRDLERPKNVRMESAESFSVEARRGLEVVAIFGARRTP